MSMYQSLTSLIQEESITVTAQDIDRLGLSAPHGFETPNIQVTDADIERLGLKAPAGFNVPAINVTKDDIERWIVCVQHLED